MKLTHKISDETISQLKSGDITAFDEAYRFYSPKLYHFSLNLVKIKPVAEGIVQEVFLKIWVNRHKIDLYRSFESYLFTIAHNTMISVLRKRSSEKEYRNYVKSLNLLEVEETIIRNLEFKELQGKLQEVVDQLPSRQKEVFRLSRDQGLSHKEIAKKLDISTNTVEVHMNRALKSIRSRLFNHSLILLLFFYLFY